MTARDEIFKRGPRVINVGLEGFAADLERLGVPVTHVDWAPPAGADPAKAAQLAALDGERVRRRMTWRSDGWSRRSPSWWTAGPLARHSRSRIARCSTRDRRSRGPGVCAPPCRRPSSAPSATKAWAPDDAAARDLVLAGEVRIAPCHGMGAVGPMTGIVTASMPVFVVENRTHGHRASATINEGLGKVLRFGANDDTVIQRLRGSSTRRARSSARPFARPAALISGQS